MVCKRAPAFLIVFLISMAPKVSWSSVQTLSINDQIHFDLPVAEWEMIQTQRVFKRRVSLFRLRGDTETLGTKKFSCDGGIPDFSGAVKDFKNYQCGLIERRPRLAKDMAHEFIKSGKICGKSLSGF